MRTPAFMVSPGLPSRGLSLDRAGQAEVLSLQETASFLELHPNTVRSLVREGRLPGTKVGRSWRFVEADLVRK